jgi:hypothetical protein
LQKGDVVRYGSLEAEVFRIEENYQDTGEPWANLNWISTKLPKGIPSWVACNRLEVVLTNGETPAQPAPEPHTEVTSEPATVAIDDAALRMAIGLQDLWELIHENRKLEAKYVRVRQAQLTMLQSGLIAGIDKKQLPPPLSPASPELYVRGEEKFASKKGALSDLEIAAGSAKNFLHDKGYTIPIAHLKEMLSELFYEEPQHTAPPSRTLSEDEEDAIGQGERVPVASPKRTRQRMTDERLISILQRIDGIYPSNELAQSFGFKNAESMMSSLRDENTRARWTRLGWGIIRDPISPSGRRQVITKRGNAN